MNFQIYNCDFGFKMDGVKYEFDHVAELQSEDPERNRLTRGANAKNKTGLVYKDGLREPKRWTIPILQMSAALKEALDLAFDQQKRIEPYCIDRKDGSMKMMKQAILSNRPQQLTLDDSAESMNVSIEFESFEPIEVHKS